MAKQQKTPPAAQPPVPFVRVETQIEGRPESLTADPKTFKSGKGGYWGQARWTIGGRKYMVQLQVVEITNGD